jgi:multidrug efflux pump subunit AcrB
VMLQGMVVSNSILIVDFSNVLRSEGHSVREAVAHACRIRLRPILMTSLATIVGLLPMALKLETGSEAYAPLALAIIGGLVVSQALTLYTTPVVYLYFDRLRHWWERARGHHGTSEVLPSETPSWD